MIFLAITPNGLQQAIKLAESNEISIWCGADTVSEADYETLAVCDISRFAYALQDQHPDVLADALRTIKEHHPDEMVWIEHGLQA